MGRRMFETLGLSGVALVAALAASSQMQAQAKIPYPSMAPLDQYLIADRNAEIAMARSAAPEAISARCRCPRPWTTWLRNCS